MPALAPRLVLALLFLPAAGASAQLNGYVDIGAALPAGTFAEVANPGPRVAAGALREAASGITFGADVAYARATHSAGEASSELIGLTAWVGYSLRADVVTVMPLAGVGVLSHARRADDFPGLDSTRAGAAARVGLRVSGHVGRLGLFAAGGYEKGLGSLGTSAFPSDFGTVSAGVTLPLGS